MSADLPELEEFKEFFAKMSGDGPGDPPPPCEDPSVYDSQVLHLKGILHAFRDPIATLDEKKRQHIRRSATHLINTVAHPVGGEEQWLFAATAFIRRTIILLVVLRNETIVTEEPAVPEASQ